MDGDSNQKRDRVDCSSGMFSGRDDRHDAVCVVEYKDQLGVLQRGALLPFWV